MARALFPELTIRGVNVLEVTVYGGMVLASIGVCAIYAVFILGNIPVLNHHIERWSVLLATKRVYILPTNRVSPASRHVAIGCTVLMLGLALVRTYAWLALTSILGDIAVTSGLVREAAHYNNVLPQSIFLW